MKTFDAMVLAAGEGRRLKPLTDQLAKPLIPLLGQTLLRRAVDRVAAEGPQQVVVNTHYHAKAIARAVENMAGVRAPLRLSHEEIVLGATPCPFLKATGCWCITPTPIWTPRPPT